MNAIQGTIELLHRSELKKNQIKMVETISASNKALLQLLDGILDLSKIGDDKLELEEEAFNLHLLLSNLMEISKLKTKEKNIEIDLSINEKIPTMLNGDELRLRQILWNIISNAIKFTDKGSVSIAINQIPTTSTGTRLEFLIKDTGIGIPTEKLQVIFDPFVQVNSSRSRRHHGTGLGLAITKKLIDLMGGTIYVQSDVNKGSNFQFELEFQEARQTVFEQESKKLSVPANLSILLVEDEPVSQTIVEALLTDEGYQVKVASSGFEALKKITEQPFDIILMDLRMPEMDGLETTSQIRSMSDKKIASTKIIAFTGDVMKETVQQCEAIGMDGVIAKPIDIHEVNRVIANVFNNVV